MSLMSNCNSIVKKNPCHSAFGRYSDVIQTSIYNKGILAEDGFFASGTISGGGVYKLKSPHYVITLLLQYHS
jgi:hypothetical protein